MTPLPIDPHTPCAADFQVDKLRLDVEWERQAELCRKYGRLLARKRSALDEAVMALDVLEAELGLAIRNDPGKYAIPGRISNDVVKEVIYIQPEYQEKRRAVNKAKYEVELFVSGVKAMEHKKSALEDLVKLHGRDYYADPRLTPETTPEVIDSIKDRSRTASRRNRERDS